MTFRVTPRLGLRLALVAIALVVLGVRLMPRFHARGMRAVGSIPAQRPINRPGGGPAPVEAYPIYSALYQAPASGAASEPLLFAKNSQTEIPQIVGGSCLRPSSSDERSLAAAFDAANARSREWQPQFDIPAGYRLLSPDDVTQAADCFVRHDRKSSQCAAYAQVQHVRYLGIPALDASGTHALVSIIKSCGHDCGSGGIFEVEKVGATWKRMPTTDFTRDCSWVY